MGKIRFGPAGYPAAAKSSPQKAFEILSEAGLTAFEFAAVRGLRTKEEVAKEIGALAAKFDISMSLHGAYFINLASKDPDIRQRSKQRLIKALTYAPWMNVKRIVFHPGTYGGLSNDDAHSVIRDALIEVWDEAGKKAGGAFLSPEIAGKINSFGSVDQIIRLCSEVEGAIPTIDWAHLYARSQGEINNKSTYLSILNKFEDALGSRFLDNMHFHVSGIIYTKAGEASHRPLGAEWGPDLLPLMEIVSEVGYRPTFISETPEPIRGALYTKFLLEELESSKK